MVGIVTGIVIDMLEQPYVYVKEAEASEVVEVVESEYPREVRLEVIIDWTDERIEQEIDKVFPDAPIMHKVMDCESGGKIDAYNPTNNSHDNGLFQISDLYHGTRVRSLGLDVGNPADNIRFARILYDESGLQPWSASEHCWR